VCIQGDHECCRYRRGAVRLSKPLGAHEVGEIADAHGDGATRELAKRQFLLLLRRLPPRRARCRVAITAILEIGPPPSLLGSQGYGGADVEAGGARLDLYREKSCARLA
jgi:hypothetical protein